MKTGLGEQNCSASRSAVDGGSIALAVAALRQIHHAISADVLENLYRSVIGEWIVGASGGAILFAIITAPRNRLNWRQ